MDQVPGFILDQDPKIINQALAALPLLPEFVDIDPKFAVDKQLTNYCHARNIVDLHNPWGLRPSPFTP